MKILVAEDNPVNQTLLKTMLQKMEHTVTLADNGKEALEMATAEPFDLIFMDIEMPLMGGLEATRRLREAGQETPVIALSARVVEEERETYQKAGMNDAVPKPFSKETLAEKITMWGSR